MLDAEEAARLTDVPNIRERGTRLGNWLTKEQANELLTVPDRQTLKGKRDYVILGLLVGCALRRRELAALDVAEIQLRENRWVIVDLRGKGGRVRTVAVPLWVKHAINAWQAAASIEDGPLLRQIRKGGKVGQSLSDWAVWPSSSRPPARSGSRTSVPTTSAAPAPMYGPPLCRKRKVSRHSGLRKCSRPQAS